MRKVAVIGVGLHAYGKWPEKTPKELVQTAVEGALTCAGLEWKDIQSGWCGHIGQGMTAGARLFAPLGQTGLSITNVENASATGSYAFRGAFHEVALGEFDVALAVGVDMLPRKPAGDRPTEAGASTKAGAAPRGEAAKRTSRTDGGGEKKSRPPTSPMLKFAQDTQAHMDKYGTTLDQVAQVSVKQHYNAARNPYAQYQEEVTLAQVHGARVVAPPLTVLHCCPFGDGAAAAILASEEVVARLGIRNPVWVSASVSCSTDGRDPELSALTRHTAQLALDRAGLRVDDLGMIELHDAATIEEIQYAEALGLCPEGQGGRLVESGATEIGGRIPINTSGGLLAMGHPFGPTGLGQIAEIYWQLRGEAERRQIPTPPRNGLAHMIGLGGTCIVHILQR